MIRSIAMMFLCATLAACATTSGIDDAKRLIDAGKIEEGLGRIEQLSERHASNAQFRSALVVHRELALSRLVGEAEIARASGDRAQAHAIYQRVLRLHPGQPKAMAGLAQLDAERRADGVLVQAEAALKGGDLPAAERHLRTALAELPGYRPVRDFARRFEERRRSQAMLVEPQLGNEFAKPITLEFRDASLRQVFEIISRSHGINFVFDKDVRPDLRVTIFVRQTAVEDVVNLILATNQLDRKVLNASTILIYPKTPAKAREYQELVTRTFYLGNAEAKQTLNMIRTLVKTRDVYVDEKLNMIVMRDTPAAIRYAEKLIASQDLAEPEVMLEVEVLEVSRSRLQELGLRFPDRVNFGPLGANGAPGPSQFELASSALRATVTNPALILNLKLQDGQTNVLANPRIRVRNREKARIHIGEKVPVITTTSTANVGVSASVSYLETGLKLDVEPNVYLEDEIAIKVGLEVSNIIETLDLFNTRAYRLGTRNASTTLRLRDGETQILAGLIQDEDRRSTSKVPGIGELPLVGRLFSSSNDTASKNEIVLLITPRVVRNIARPEARYAEIASGTEAAVGAPALVLRNGGPGTLKLSSKGGAAAGAGQKGRAAPAAPDAGPIEFAVEAPPQAIIGAEVGIRVGSANAQGALRRASFDVVFDPNMLRPVGVDPAQAKEGRIKVEIEAMGSAAMRDFKFQVVATQPGATSIALQNLAGVGQDETPAVLNVPAAHTLSIVAK